MRNKSQKQTEVFNCRLRKEQQANSVTNNGYSFKIVWTGQKEETKTDYTMQIS